MENPKKQAEQVALQTYKNHRDKFETVKERWLDQLSRYENKLRANSISSKTESKAALGEAYSLVENAIPRLLARKPRYRYLATGRKNAKAIETYDEFSEYQWRKAKVQKKLKMIVKWGLICGLSGWRLGWKDEKKVFKKRTKEILGIEVTNRLLLPYAKTKVKDVEEVTSTYTFDGIKPFDLVWSVGANDIDDSRVVGYKNRGTVSELKADGYKIDQLVYNIKDSDKWQRRMDERDGLSEYKLNMLVREEDIEYAPLYVRVTHNGVYQYYVITVAAYGDSDPVVIRSEVNTLDRKFAPIGMFTPVGRPGKMYGFGLIEPVAGILDASEDTTNMALEALWTDIARPMEYNPANVLAPDSIKYGSRVLVPVKNLGQSVAVLPTPTPNMNGVQYMNNFLTTSKQNVSGITDFQTGADQKPGAKTLGEIQIKTQESNARIQMITDNMEEQIIEPLGVMTLWVNQQFLIDSSKILYEVVGKKGSMVEKSIKNDDITAIKNVTVITNSSTLVAQQSELQKWSLMIDKAQIEAQQTNPVKINRLPMWERLLEEGALVQDIETFLPNATEEEENEVQGDMLQLADAKEENANPLTARVLPTDNPEIHIRLHQAEIKVREQEVQQTQDERAMQELQLLTEHLNAHTQQQGGQVPPSQVPVDVNQPQPTQ